MQTVTNTQQRKQKLHKAYIEQAKRVKVARNHPDLCSRVVLLRLEARARVTQEERRFADLGLDLLAVSGVELEAEREGQGQS